MSKFETNRRYNYDPIKEANKYCRLEEFFHILPKLRNDIRNTLNNFDYSKDHIIYLVLAIIDLCHFRIGNLKYKKSTGSVTLKVNQITRCSDSNNMCSLISFIGKRSVLNECKIQNEKINHILTIINSYKNPDDFIFTYKDFHPTHHTLNIASKYVNTTPLDLNSNIRQITAKDVNELLHRYGNITSKMFRTWKANYYFIKNIKNCSVPQNETQIKKNISLAISKTAEKLHHTKGICRRSYIDSRIINLYKKSPIHFITSITNTVNSNPYLLDDEQDIITLISKQC